VLRQGGILEQYDTPSEILAHPVDEFVADFVGADRGLKRLGVTRIDVDRLEAGSVLSPEAALSEARRCFDGAAPVVDADRRLVGVLHRAAADGDGVVADRMAPPGPTVDAGRTLKDAYAALLLSDAGWVAVTSEGRYVGLLTPDSLHAAVRRSSAG
jgi:osmoprotectant transport system ATP-binding protein